MGNFSDGGYFSGAVAFHVIEIDGFSLFGRKGVYEIPHVVEFAGTIRLVDSKAAMVIRGRVEGHFSVLAAPAKIPLASIRGCLKEPVLQMGCALESRIRPEKCLEDLLINIFGGLRFGYLAEGKSVDIAPESVYGVPDLCLVPNDGLLARRDLCKSIMRCWKGFCFP
ncbi:hypothetical protein N1614_02565 [Adlercreutzia muris]|nr:hypothetical protein [Adlercreutzia muris]MCU7584239.1 hypothetical protein [Adlercreutzia muris]